MSRRNGEMPRTSGDIFNHPGVLELIKRPEDLVSLSLESGVPIALGSKPNGEFWAPHSRNAKADRLMLTVLTINKGGLAAVTFTDADRRIVITSDGIIERVRAERRTLFDVSTNIETEWNNHGRIQRLQIVHDQGRNNTPHTASVEFWQSFGTNDPLLELVDRQLFQPAQTTSAIILNQRIGQYPTELVPGFLLEGGRNELPIKDGWTMKVEWSIETSKQISDFWQRSGLGELARAVR
jgi:hypothetical protein